jgi:hypothetical protein
MQFTGIEGYFGGAPQYIQSRVWEGFSTAAKQTFWVRSTIISMDNGRLRKWCAQMK